MYVFQIKLVLGVFMGSKNKLRHTKLKINLDYNIILMWHKKHRIAHTFSNTHTHPKTHTHTHSNMTMTMEKLNSLYRVVVDFELKTLSTRNLALKGPLGLVTPNFGSLKIYVARDFLLFL